MKPLNKLTDLCDYQLINLSLLEVLSVQIIRMRSKLIQTTTICDRVGVLPNADEGTCPPSFSCRLSAGTTLANTHAI